MLGNDIVNFEVDNKKYDNQRYIDRILSSSEQKHLSQSKDKNAFLWALWSAKEASYKAIQKLELDTIFSPPSFELDESTLTELSHHIRKQPMQGHVHFKSHSIKIQFTWPNKFLVHCVAIKGKWLLFDQVKIAISKEDPESNDDQSFQVRCLAQKLFKKNDIKAKIIRPELSMSGYIKPGPPVMVANDIEHLPHQISLSHHQTYLAVALLLNQKQ